MEGKQIKKSEKESHEKGKANEKWRGKIEENRIRKEGKGESGCRETE